MSLVSCPATLTQLQCRLCSKFGHFGRYCFCLSSFMQSSVMSPLNNFLLVFILLHHSNILSHLNNICLVGTMILVFHPNDKDTALLQPRIPYSHPVPVQLCNDKHSAITDISNMTPPFGSSSFRPNSDYVIFSCILL